MTTPTNRYQSFRQALEQVEANQRTLATTLSKEADAVNDLSKKMATLEASMASNGDKMQAIKKQNDDFSKNMTEFRKTNDELQRNEDHFRSGLKDLATSVRGAAQTLLLG